MNNRETACFAICATAGCITSALEDLKAEAVQLAATKTMIFEELGV